MSDSDDEIHKDNCQESDPDSVHDIEQDSEQDIEQDRDSDPDNDTSEYFEIEKHISQRGLRSLYDSLLVKNKINLEPVYQREFIWNSDKQNLLIDSIMRSFIVPNIIFIKDYSENYTYECIDGQHRLNVIKCFITGEKLKGHYVRWQHKKGNRSIENIFYEKNKNTENNKVRFKRYMTEYEKDRFDEFSMTLCIINSKHSFKDICTIFNRLQNGEKCSRSVRIKNLDHPLSELIRKSGVYNNKQFKKTKICKYLWDIFFPNKKNKSSPADNNLFVSIIIRYAIIYVKGIDEITSYLDIQLYKDIEIKSNRVDTSSKSSDLILENMECFLEYIAEHSKNKNLAIHMFYILADIYIHTLNCNMSIMILKNIISSDIFITYNKKHIIRADKILEIRNLIIDIFSEDLPRVHIINQPKTILKNKKDNSVTDKTKTNYVTIKAVSDKPVVKSKQCVVKAVSVKPVVKSKQCVVKDVSDKPVVKSKQCVVKDVSDKPVVKSKQCAVNKVSDKLVVKSKQCAVKKVSDIRINISDSDNELEYQL